MITEMIQAVDVNNDLSSLCQTDSSYISFNGSGNMCNFSKSSKEYFDAVSPFMNNKCRSSRNIILKENYQIITYTTELCEIFSTFFSWCANNIGQPGEIDMSELDFLTNIIDRH